MNVVIYPYSIEHSYIKEYKKLFRYNIICFMCYGNILPINNQNDNDNDDYCTFTDLVDGKISFDDFDTFCIIDKVPDENELYKIVEFVCSNGKNIICVEEEYLDQIEKICKRYNVKLLQCNYETIETPEKKWNYDSYSLLRPRNQTEKFK